MLKKGESITIRYSDQLARNGNALLANKVGVITRILMHNGCLAGVYVDVKLQRRTKNFYIPFKSIEGPDDITRLRALAILKTTKL